MFTNRSPRADEQTVEYSLLDLPDIGEEQVYPKLTLRECGLFAQTSQATEQATAFLRLLPSAVDAEPESYQQEDETKLAAIAILKKHPELLFRIGMVTDHFGRKIFASPYRLLLGTGDKWAVRQVHQEIIPDIEDGEAQAEAHFKAQFPTCPWPPTADMGEEAYYDDRNKAQIEQVIAQLNIIVAKINADPCTNGVATLDATKKAVEELEQIFKPKEGEIIKTGLHFPLAIMKEMYKVYNASTWNGVKLAFFSREVIGKALAASTAVDGQCCKNGLGRLDMEKGPDRRDGLFCQHPKGIPAKLAPISDKLGRTMFVDPYDGESCFLTSTPGSFSWYDKNGVRRGVGGAFGAALRAGPRVAGAAPRLDNLCRTKAETYCSYYAATRREVNTWSI